MTLLKCAPMTVAATRERWVKEKRLEDLPRTGLKPMLDAKEESLLVALACSGAPEGRSEWTMQLLADKLVELKVIEPIGDETVRRVLKKTNSNIGKKTGCILEVNTHFVWRIEDVLDLYAESFKPWQPVVCFDNRPCQLVADVFEPLPRKAGRAQRFDYAYERHGVCNALCCSNL